MVYHNVMCSNVLKVVHKVNVFKICGILQAYLKKHGDLNANYVPLIFKLWSSNFN